MIYGADSDGNHKSPSSHPARFITHSIYSFSFCVRCFRFAAAEMLKEQEAAYEMLIYDYLIFIRRPRFSLQSAKSPFPSCKKGKLSCCELPLNNSPPRAQTTTNPLTIKTLIHKTFLKAIFMLICVGEGRRARRSIKKKFQIVQSLRRKEIFGVAPT